MFYRKKFILLLLSTHFFLNTSFSHEAISITNPSPMIMMHALAGREPEPITSQGASYSISSSNKISKISAFLNDPMPPHTTLSIQMSAPHGAQSLGRVILSTTPQDLVVHIQENTTATLPFFYIFSSTTKAGTLPLATKIVTFTLSNE